MTPPAVSPAHNRVLLALAAVALAALGTLPFVIESPNRLLSGTGKALPALMPDGTGWALALGWPLAVALLGSGRPRTARNVAAVALAALGLAGGLAIAGARAAGVEQSLGPLARTSLGSGFWVVVGIGVLMAGDAVRRLGSGAAPRLAATAALLVPVAAVLAAGQLDALSLLKEHANRADVFEAALTRHVALVAATLVPALALGVPLGVLAHRWPRRAAPLLAVLNGVQTVPSIALFALLMAPLAALAAAAPGWGIEGTGAVPAVVALTLYALLPVVRGTVSGLDAVPPAARDAATALGMTPAQVFARIDMPLAAPVWMAGLRVAVVQTIGLAVVAALIGAGGLGALMFQGLASSAADLVWLAVIPVVTLAVAADAVLGFGVRVQRDGSP